MAKKEDNGVSAVDEKAIALLRESYPVEQGFQRMQFPRLSLISQDVTEEVKNPVTKKKEIKIITEAGTFMLERQTDEEDEDTGKKIWEKIELGEEIEGVILYQRKQLKFFDGERYTSSPIYDTDDEIIPLWKDKNEVDRGTPKELKAKKEYQGFNLKGKPVSKLEDNIILYVLFEHEGEKAVYQMNLRGTSMYAFMTYRRKILPPTVLTTFSSEAKENGAISWNQMTFEATRGLDKKELQDVLERVGEIRNNIGDEKDFYAQVSPENEVVHADVVDALPGGKKDSQNF